MEKYQNVFVNEVFAREVVTKETLLVICDTNRPSIMQYPELLNIVENKVLIDHHRKTEEEISKMTLSYHEAYSSSTCELVSELLMYIDDSIYLDKKEAEAIYAGIMIDTKDFVQNTGVRTFEAATFLKGFGVDTALVKRHFNSSLEDYILKSEIIKSAEIYSDDIAIAICL